MNTENPVTPQDKKVVVYETPDGEMRVDVRLDQETVWLTQQSNGGIVSGVNRQCRS